MTPYRFTQCLAALHWSNALLAEILGCDEAMVKAWATGNADIPPKLSAWLETLAHCHEAAEVGKPRGLRGKKHSDPSKPI